MQRMLKKAVYCFDDELVAGMSMEEPVNKTALCLKCKITQTPHRTGICMSCRSAKCESCGKEVKQQSKRRYCKVCGEAAQRKRAYEGYGEDELNGCR